MMQNPSPSTGRQPVQQGRHSAPVKRDINLLPANESSSKATRLGVIALAVLAGAAVFAYLAILMPLGNLQIEKNRAAALEKQAEQKQALAAEFDALVPVRNGLLEMQASLDSSDAAYLHPADLFGLVSGACPDSITLISVSLSGGGLSIKGQAGSDTDVAQFLVNLKAVKQFTGADLNSTRGSEAYVRGDGQPRAFEVTARMALPEASPAPTAGGDAK